MRGGGEGDLGGSCCDTSSANQWPFVVNLLFSDPEEWRRHHCYGACKIALHVIRQPPTNTTKNKKNGSVKILFLLLFSLSLCCSSKIKLLLPWSPAKKSIFFFNQKFNTLLRALPEFTAKFTTSSPLLPVVFRRLTKLLFFFLFSVALARHTFYSSSTSISNRKKTR